MPLRPTSSADVGGWHARRVRAASTTAETACTTPPYRQTTRSAAGSSGHGAGTRQRLLAWPVCCGTLCGSRSAALVTPDPADPLGPGPAVVAAPELRVKPVRW